MHAFSNHYSSTKYFSTRQPLELPVDNHLGASDTILQSPTDLFIIPTQAITIFKLWTSGHQIIISKQLFKTLSKPPSTTTICPRRNRPPTTTSTKPYRFSKHSNPPPTHLSQRFFWEIYTPTLIRIAIPSDPIRKRCRSFLPHQRPKGFRSTSITTSLCICTTCSD